MRTISVMIKPASSLCNLRCRYCFYADISENRTVASHGVMGSDTADLLIERINEALNGRGTANISFQGGEPTAAGLDYFRHFVTRMKEYPGIQVNYALQTNGTLINEEWAQFFHENKFLIGVSLDGYKLNMDEFRFDAEGRSVYYTITDNIKMLKRNKVDFNILTVVTRELSAHAKALYRFYRDSKFEYVQLIPCLPGFHESTDIFALTPETYASFYNAFFDEWIRDVRKGKGISVNLFENLYGMAHGQYPYQCGMLGRCTVQFVVESNGDVYPCDFFCLDEYLLGNLEEKSFEQLASSENARKFLSESKCTRKPCENCEFARICNGGCRRQNVCWLNEETCAYRTVLQHVLPVLSRM